MAETTVTTADGAELAVESLGDPGAPAVLLLGGGGWSRDWWDDELCRLITERGRRVVRYDPRDAGEIRIYHHDAFLCRAVAPELAGETFTLKQVQAARTARRRALREQLHQRRSLVDALPVDTRWTPAADTAADNNTSGADLASPAISEQTPAGEAPAPTGKTKGLRMYATD